MHKRRREGERGRARRVGCFAWCVFYRTALFVFLRTVWACFTLNRVSSSGVGFTTLLRSIRRGCADIGLEHARVLSRGGLEPLSKKVVYKVFVFLCCLVSNRHHLWTAWRIWGREEE